MQNFKIEGMIKLPHDKDMEKLFSEIISLIESYDGISCEIFYKLTDENEPETII